jgi:hypothetical protein
MKLRLIRDFFEKKIVFSGEAFFVLSSLFLIKLGNVLVDQTLWAEDGSVFIFQSRELGAQSIWTEYSGYLHTYPRLVSYFASFFDLSFTPIIFLIFCALAYVALFCVITKKVTLLKKGCLESLLLTIIIIFQPHRDEVFFNLTNIQWWIGSALCIFVLVYCDDQQKIGFLKSALIFVAATTGPFSLFLLPFLVFNLVTLRNWRDRNSVYIPVFLGAFVQLFLVLYSQRIYSGSDFFEYDLEHFLIGIKTLIFFGSYSELSRFFSIILWIMIFSKLLRVGLNFVQKNKNNAQEMQAVSLLLAAAFFYVSPIFLLRISPEILTPLGVGSRYFFIVYALIFFAAWLLFLNNKVLRAIVLLVMLLIDCLNQPLQWGESRANHQFQSYVEFSKYNKDVAIKTNPYAIPNDLRWKIILPNRELKKISDERVFEVFWKNDGDFVVASRNAFFEELSQKCSASKHLGIELKIHSAKSGILGLAWGNEGVSLAKNFLEEQFFVGESKIYFAIPASEGMHLVLKRSSAEDGFKIKTTKIYCL